MSKPRGHAPTIHRIAGVPLHPFLTQTAWGGQILTFHLNYVADPLLFLFEWTNNYRIDNQKLT